MLVASWLVAGCVHARRGESNLALAEKGLIGRASGWLREQCIARAGGLCWIISLANGSFNSLMQLLGAGVQVRTDEIHTIAVIRNCPPNY